MRAGELVDPDLVGPAAVAAAREHHRAALGVLPPFARDVSYGAPCLPVIVSVPSPNPVP